MTLAPGDKFITLQTRTGPVTLPYVAPAVGEKALFVPDGKGHHIAVKYAAPSVGDSFLMVPDKAGNYIAVKPGEATPETWFGFWDDIHGANNYPVQYYAIEEDDIMYPLPGATIWAQSSWYGSACIIYESYSIPKVEGAIINSQAVMKMAPLYRQARGIQITAGHTISGTNNVYLRLFGQSVATGSWISTTEGESGYGTLHRLAGNPGVEYPINLDLGETCRNIRILVTYFGVDAKYGSMFFTGDMTLF